MNEEKTTIYGKHVVKEAMKMRPDVVRAVYLEDSIEDEAVLACLKEIGIRRRSLSPKNMPKDIPNDAVHQGYVAEIVADKLMVSYEDFMREREVTSDTALIVLGEVQDPHNVGAVIRSAAAFGLSGVLIPEHRQAQVTGTVVKVSAGLAFHIPLISIGNVNQTIENLKQRGFWVYGLDDEAKQSVATELFEKASAFVLGNEASGVREKTLEHCDIPLRIPIQSGAESLNASVAAAVVFYAWRTRHPFK